MMRRITVIALCGKKRSGKNTAADALKNHFGLERPCIEMSFAAPIKKCVSDLFGFTQDQVDGDKKEVPDDRWEGKTPRQVIQFFGTEMMQHKLQELLPKVGRNFWTNRLIKGIKDRESGDTNVLAIVTDLRFKHEFNALQSVFGEKFLCVKIERPTSYKHFSSTDTHSSEKEVEEISAHVNILNAYDKETFERDCVNLLRARLSN